MPDKNACFPVCERDNSDAQKFIKKATHGVPSAAVKVIKSFQPYHAGSDFRTNHLWRLNKLWNIDKHRHLTPHSILPEWQFCTHDVTQILSRQLEDGSGVEFSLPLADKDKIEFNPDCGVQFTVRDTVEGIDLTMGDLASMYQFVANTVLPAFAGFFPQPVAVGQTP